MRGAGAAVYVWHCDYEQSVQNLGGTSLDGDMVFSDGYASQLAKASGTVEDGIALSLNVVV